MAAVTCPPALTALGEKIKATEATVTELRSMGDKMQACGHFDDREVSAVAAVCVDMMEDVTRMKADLASSLSIWEGKIVHLERRLVGRANIIEMYERALVACPAVMDIVAAEQVDLQTQLDDAKGQLCHDAVGASSPSAQCSVDDTKSDDGDSISD